MAEYSLIAGIRVCNEFTPETFNRLTSIGPKFRLGKDTFQVFECSCGNAVVRKVVCVKHGQAKSCGCLKSEVLAERNKATAKHGYFGSPTYRSWNAMITRCEDLTHMAYHNYGGRGIKIHPSIRNFIGFLACVGERPSLDYSLDRIDNNGDYEPGNVRWATRREQGSNTRTNRRVEFEGRTQILAEWAREYSMPVRLLYSRLGSGWSIEDALTLPKGTRNPKRSIKA